MTLSPNQNHLSIGSRSSSKGGIPLSLFSTCCFLQFSNGETPEFVLQLLLAAKRLKIGRQYSDNGAYYNSKYLISRRYPRCLVIYTFYTVSRSRYSPNGRCGANGGLNAHPRSRAFSHSLYKGQQMRLLKLSWAITEYRGIPRPIRPRWAATVSPSLSAFLATVQPDAIFIDDAKNP